MADPLTPSLSPSDGEGVAFRPGEGRFMGKGPVARVSGAEWVKWAEK